MPIAIEQLPDDVDALKKIIAEQKNEITILGERVRLLQSEIFGRKSEKWNGETNEQQLIFNEMERYAAAKPDGPEEKPGTGASKVKRRRSRRGRKPKDEALPDYLPREHVYHELSPEEIGVRRFIRWETSESLVIENPRIYVRSEHCGVYAPPEGTEVDDGPVIKTAPRPLRLLQGCIASAELLAHVIISKFCDALPLHRQEKIFERWGVAVSRQSMCNWGLKAAERCERLMELLEMRLVAGPRLESDETTVQVLKEPNRSNTRKSYMWAFRGGTRDGPVVLFKYRETRGAAFLKEMLAKYRGPLVTDGFKSYDGVAAVLNIVHAGCWDHARRKFRDVLKAGKSDAAEIALNLIGKLYRVEKYGRRFKLSPDQLRELRRRNSKPVVNEFRKWLESTALETPSRALLGRAVAYALGQWPKLVVFLEDGNVPISTIAVENAIRPFVIGRRNWLFAGSPRGAGASATFYSLIETAKANVLDPYSYLRYLFEKLPRAENDEDLEALLPTDVTMDDIRLYFKK